jgi:hypothetical protein
MFFNKLEFVPGKPLQPHLTFASKSRACLSEAPLRLLALATNIGLGWKGSQGELNLASSEEEKMLNKIDTWWRFSSDMKGKTRPQT